MRWRRAREHNLSISTQHRLVYGTRTSYGARIDLSGTPLRYGSRADAVGGGEARCVLRRVIHMSTVLRQVRVKCQSTVSSRISAAATSKQMYIARDKMARKKRDTWNGARGGFSFRQTGSAMSTGMEDRCTLETRSSLYVCPPRLEHSGGSEKVMATEGSSYRTYQKYPRIFWWFPLLRTSFQ